MHWETLNAETLLVVAGLTLVAMNVIAAVLQWTLVTQDVSATRDVLMTQIPPPDLFWVQTGNGEFLRVALQSETQDRWGLTRVRTLDQDLRLQRVAAAPGRDPELISGPGLELDAHLATSLDFILLDRSGEPVGGNLAVTVESLSRKLLSKTFVLQATGSAAPLSAKPSSHAANPNS